MAQKEPTEREIDLLGAINAFAESAYNADNTDELAVSRALATDRYLGKNIEPAPSGRSQVRDRSVFETIEWIKPSLLRIFCSGHDVAEFDPIGPEDIELADQESQYINYVVTRKNQWHQIVNDWFSDALLQKNGYAYAYWDRTVATETEEYEQLSDNAFAMLVQDDEVTVIEHTQTPDEDTNAQLMQQFQQTMMQFQQVAMQAQQSGQPVPQPPQPPAPAFFHAVKLKRTNEKGQVKICALPPEHCKIDINTASFTLEGCNYFEYGCDKTIGELRAYGFDVEDEIADDSYSRFDNPVDLARDLYNESHSSQDSSGYNDPSLKRVHVRNVWVRFDFNEDGIPEFQYVVVVGRNVIHRSECPEIPVSSITPVPMAHRHVGMSVADTVADIEDINTAFTRQAIDNLFFSNTPRIAASDRVNMSDLLDSRPGGIIRVDGQPPQELMPVVIPDMFPQAVQALQFFDSRRMNRTGINAYFQGTDANVLNKTASGIQQLTSSAAQRVEMIARLFADGVERLFLIVHRLYIQHGHKQEVVQLRNKWTEINPSEWRRRNNVRITVGLGTGNKEGQMANLMQQFQMQMAVIPLKVASPQNIYQTALELTKASGTTNPETFWTDPSTLPPDQPQPPLEIILEQMKEQHAKQMEQMKGQFTAQSQQFEQQHLAQKAQMDDSTKRYIAELDARVEIQKAGMSQETEAAKIQSTQELEVTKLVSGENTRKAELDHDKQKVLVDRDGRQQELSLKDKEINMKAVDSKKQESFATNVKQVQGGLDKIMKTLEGKKATGVTKVRDASGKMIAARIKRSDGSEDEVPIQ